MAEPKFSRQHYRAIADVICQNTRTDSQDIPGLDFVRVDALVSALADIFEQDNPLFSRDKFFAACYGWKVTKARIGGER